MAQRRMNGEELGRERSRREEREQRILNAAADLLQKWGYRKTTMEDIARAAGVAKGTLYLSWKTREVLFMALIEREQRASFGEIMLRMEEDPAGMTLPGLVKHSILATFENPLLRALALQDTEFLGELITREYSTAAYQGQMQSYMAILDRLRACGVIRSDIDLRDQAITIISVSWGFLLVDPLLPEAFKFLSDKQMAERIYVTLQRLLEPDIPPSPEQVREGMRAFKVYMEQILEMLQSTERKFEAEA